MNDHVMVAERATRLQQGLLLWRELLAHLRGLEEREQTVLLDILVLALARAVSERVEAQQHGA
jgi:hypothetical protein